MLPPSSVPSRATGPPARSTSAPPPDPEAATAGSSASAQAHVSGQISPKSPPPTSGWTAAPGKSSPLNQAVMPSIGQAHARRLSQQIAAAEGSKLANGGVSAASVNEAFRQASRFKRKVLGSQDRLRQEMDGVVKRRKGGVLTRGFILKTDHYPTGRALHLDLEITGAPNFRAPNEEGLNVYGCAQPTEAGLRSILTLLGCQPVRMVRKQSRRQSSMLGQRPSLASWQLERAASGPASQAARVQADNDDALEEQGQAVWFSTREETLIYVCGRPYVLRDATSPFSSLTLSDRATNLEDIERRLKLDILDEARRYGGMVLFHDEVAPGELVPTWQAVDETSVKTPKEVYDEIRRQGWRVDYWRIPIAPDRPIEDNYLDAYVSVLRDIDPMTTSLVFNCGMGVVRTTFGMIAALLLRRKQMIMHGLDDPFPAGSGGSGFQTASRHLPAPGVQAAQIMEQATHQQELNKSLLKMTQLLDKTANAIQLLTHNPALLEQLRKAHMGNYQIVLSLLSSLDSGKQIKRLVDEIIDNCEAVVNLRENILQHRITYSTTSMDEKRRGEMLNRAIRALEQYFDLIAFAAYVEEEDAGSSGVSFSSWLKGRPEVWNQIRVMRRQGGDRLFSFAPVHDLSIISRSTDLAEGRRRQQQQGGELDLQGGKVLGDEWADLVVKNRNGIMLRSSTLLKSDLWLTESASSNEGVRGAVGFRQVTGTSIFATGQPTQDAISSILQRVRERCHGITSVVWICLREEPLVMINGSPYCLRRDSVALRNMRDYTGVSASRLEVLEERLKSDVIAEIGEFQGRVLLHTESSDGQVVPVWESVDKSDVASIREIMDEAATSTKDVHFSFARVPVTSESSPDFHDITQLLEICRRTDLARSAFILNDQLGRGRSSTTAVIMLLIQRWMTTNRQTRIPSTRGTDRSKASTEARQNALGEGGARISWQVINSCLRVVRNGLEIKRVVDEAIDATASHFNIRDAIQDFRLKAEEATDPPDRQAAVERGLFYLQRYFHLLLFQAYLDDTDPDADDPYSFESFVKHRPVFKTLETELMAGGLESLAPLDRVEPADGMALPDEVVQVVAGRSGVILSAQTILKVDLFVGLQKQSLPERVEGAANYRKVPLIVGETIDPDDPNEEFVYGTGMPSGPGLRNALVKMGGQPGGPRKIKWTSLREEPVLYVKARPHVLRLVDKPLTNVETTGVTAAVVERMELALKQDVLKEIREGQGRLLLHDEKEIKPGHFEIVPIWETVREDEVKTPKEIYEEVIQEGYQVDYLRVAITDEQAPLPATLQNIVRRVARGLEDGSDFVFNCQMGRGRTTTGMIVASLIATIRADKATEAVHDDMEDESIYEDFGTEADLYLNGEYKTILQLVTVLSHGKQAKRLTDRAINQMEGVQNLRKAIYDFKLRADSAEPGSAKHSGLMHQTVNYLYRYGTLIVLANFLLECKEGGIPLEQTDFPAWMQQHREIRSVLSRKALD